MGTEVVVTIGAATVVVGATVVVTGATVVVTRGATEVVVVAAAIVVVDFCRPCFGRVVTVVPSAMVKVVLIGGRSPIVVTPVTVAVHSPGARSCRPASSETSAAPGRVMGTLIVYPGKFGFVGTRVILKF